MSEKIVIFGDSIVRGATDTEMGGWPNRLNVAFIDPQSALYTKIMPLGISGSTVRHIVDRIDNEVSHRHPSVLMFAVGINDSLLQNKTQELVTQEQFKNDLRTLVKKARAYTSTIMFVGLTRVVESKTQPYVFRGAPKDAYYRNDRVALFNTIIQDVCREEGLFYIPTADLITDEDLPDGLHPNAEGHRKIFERVKDFLLEHKIIHES